MIVGQLKHSLTSGVVTFQRVVENEPKGCSAITPWDRTTASTLRGENGNVFIFLISVSRSWVSAFLPAMPEL